MSSGEPWKPRRAPHETIDLGHGGNVLGTTQPNIPPSSTGIPPLSRQLLPPEPKTNDCPGMPTGHGLYNAPNVAESSEMLLPPPVEQRGTSPYQYPYAESAYGSHISSRRPSWGSTGSRDSPHAPFASPFDDSRPTPWDRGEEGINTQTVTQRYNIRPTSAMLIFPEDAEGDDAVHNPVPGERLRRKREVCHLKNLSRLGGLLFILLGIFWLIGYGIWVAFEKQRGPEDVEACSRDPDCLSTKVPLLQNQRTSLIDPDTPESEMTRTSNDGKTLRLVFSDEFNKDGRTFYDGDDPFFQGVDIWYGVTQDLEWYDPDAISTANGTLNIKFDAFKNHDLNYRSGMLQSWNKLCFKGGRLEASISLPCGGNVSGCWPGFWMSGNLGRPGFSATTDGMWPYSYWDKCDAGITANQSSPDGISMLPGMRLPACTCSSEDHPTPGKSRSAPEIDVIEASVGYLGPKGAGTGTASQSFQVAPFDILYLPDYNYAEIYNDNVTGMNAYRGGPYQEAFSAVTWLNNDWYDGKAYQKYGIEYSPGPTGDLSWFVGDDYTWKLDHRSLRPNGNIGQRVLPQEPMAIVTNFGMSPTFAQIEVEKLAELLPATMRVDYIRIYQDPSEESVTCDPEGYETTEYIKKHPKAYNNPNITLWKDTGYSWPTNTLVDGCEA